MGHFSFLRFFLQFEDSKSTSAVQATNPQNPQPPQHLQLLGCTLVEHATLAFSWDVHATLAPGTAAATRQTTVGNNSTTCVLGTSLRDVSFLFTFFFVKRKGIIDCAIVQGFEWLFIIYTAAKSITELLEIIWEGPTLPSPPTCRYPSSSDNLDTNYS